MAKLRSVSTAFWSDPFVEELSPKEKLLFLYLITNEKTNMLGIYESSIKKIAFETDLSKDEVEKGLKGFERVNKIKRIGNYIILVNFLKNQSPNPNMKKSAIKIYNELPEMLKIKGLIASNANVDESFESLSKGYGMLPKVEVEYEVEYEVKDERESESKPKTPAVPKENFDELISIFGSLCPKMPKPKTINTKRKKMIAARISEYSKQEVLDVMKMAGESNFMNGQNNKNWIANFDWIFKAENFLKILEGNYANKDQQPVAQNPSYLDEMREMSRKLKEQDAQNKNHG